MLELGVFYVLHFNLLTSLEKCILHICRNIFPVLCSANMVFDGTLDIHFQDSINICTFFNGGYYHKCIWNNNNSTEMK